MSPEAAASAAPVSHRKLQVAAVVAVAIAALIVVSGIVTRRSESATLRERADAQLVPTVALIHPGQGAAAARLELPGRTEAYTRAPIYARVSGYLKRWSADIGTPVKAGQLLAEIETPDLDQQLLQARAELATAQANAGLAASTAQRWKSLVAGDSVSRQEADEKAGDLTSKQSVVRASQANVDRFQALKAFTRIVAPFSGVVTARSTDVGALINVGGAPGTELFVVSDLRKLRVYVTVPQGNVASIKTGTVARLTVPERPGKSYAATVQAMSQAIAASSGGMLVQLAVDNPGAELLPGGYASVSFDLPRAATTLSLPPSALIYSKAGVRVATVGADNKVALKTVTIARDLGTVVEIGSGLAPGDRVVESPPDGVGEGDKVQVAAAAGDAGKRGGAK